MHRLSDRFLSALVSLCSSDILTIENTSWRPPAEVDFTWRIRPGPGRPSCADRRWLPAASPCRSCSFFDWL